MVFSGGLIDKADLAKDKALLSEYEERIKIITLEEYTNKMIEGTSRKLIDLVKEKLDNEDWVSNVEKIEEDQIKVITKDKYIIIAKIGEDGSVEIVAEGKDDGEPYPSLTLTQDPYNEDDGEIIKIKVEAEVEKTSKTKKVTTVRIVKPERMKQEKEYTEGGVIFEVTENGVYTFEAETNMGKTKRKTIEINISKPESDIEITSEPTTPRNTESTGTQNGIAKGPINVEIKYGDNSYIKQYRKETDESWTEVNGTTASFTVTENIAIFAKYSDGTNTFKTLTYNIKNVDNVEPTIESIETQVEGATVTVNAVAKDEAKDSKGVSAATGIEGIARYEYSINGKSYQESNKFNITSPEMNTVYVKAIDKAGNEKIESKKIDIKDVATVEITNIDNGTVNIFDDVTTTFTAKMVGMNYKYQWYYNDTAIGEQSEELSGERTIAFNVPTTTMTMDNYSGGTYKCKVTNGVGENEATAKQTVTYTISDANQMKNFAKRVNNQSITFEGKTIEQTADIDLSSVCGETIGNWEPIKSFSGTYDGKGKNISNMYIMAKTSTHQGLFGTNNGYIKNVNVSNLNIYASGESGGIVAWNTGNVESCKNLGGNIELYGAEARSGGIVGCNYNGTIKKSVNYSKIQAVATDGKHVGGIVGFNGWESGEVGKVEMCCNYGDITTNQSYAGGIVGCNMNGYIKSSYNVGNVVAKSVLAGGIAGVTHNATIENSYNIGNVTAGNGVGSISGDGSSNNVKQCYYLKGTAEGGIYGADTEGSAEAKTGTFMKSSEFVNLLGSSNWKLVAGKNKGYPVLSWEEGTAITVENYDIYWNGVISKELVLNEFTNWDIKGEVTIESDYININTSKDRSAYANVYAKDKIDLSKYNSIIIRKSNVNLKRLYIVTENLGIVNKEVIPFSFESKNTVKLGNDTYACDISTESITGWLAIDAYNTANDGNIYEIYLSTKTVEHLKAEYGQ